MILVGTAGWSIPRAEQEHFPGAGSHLERYASRLAVAEINSSFHRSHRATTWARWRDSVPESFRFSAKLPKAITHSRGLKDSSDLLVSFLDETAVLGNRLGAFLVQLPPKLIFDSALAEEFFEALRARTALAVVCEPRHESWFGESAERLLQTFEVARVAADPARVPSAAAPGGWRGMSYYRLHGSPKMYYSAYAAEFIAALAARVAEDAANRRDVWVIFDNTTLGAATRNARELAEVLRVWR
ncbi:MAG: DUF72 domain-containing protein [Chthoniobacterales bacterium]